MNISEQTSLRQRLKAIQAELIEGLGSELSEPITPALGRLVHLLDWICLEQLVDEGCGVGRPPRPRFAIGNAFIAKAVLRLPTTVALIDRLKVDRALRRICGFAWYQPLPNESTFSRAFDEFAQQRRAERVHEALIKEQLGQQLIGHLSRDSTAISARERPASQPVAALPTATVELAANATQAAPNQDDRVTQAQHVQSEPSMPTKPGRGRHVEVRYARASRAFSHYTATPATRHRHAGGTAPSVQPRHQVQRAGL